jgi:hypothetical protein
LYTVQADVLAFSQLVGFYELWNQISPFHGLLVWALSAAEAGARIDLLRQHDHHSLQDLRVRYITAFAEYNSEIKSGPCLSDSSGNLRAKSGGYGTAVSFRI